MCTKLETAQNDYIKSEKENARSARNQSTKSLICRICFDNEQADDILIRPCSCSGTVAYVHNGCLEKWVRATSKIQCSICQENFELTPIGMKNWWDCSFPRPLSDLTEDQLDFGCTIVWTIYMMRFLYLGVRYGVNTMLMALDNIIGQGAFRSLWWLSFWFNFIYYGAMAMLIIDKWIFDNTIYQFKDRSGRSYKSSYTTASSRSLTTSRRRTHTRT